MTQLDIDEYLPMTEEWDMTKEEKVEFLEQLWNIMETFARDA
jgi:hypothetical protein